MTSDRTVRVAVNGYGVIGKRVADAVAAQNDMTLAGVADVTADWRVAVARGKGYRLYGATADHAPRRASTKLSVQGDEAFYACMVDNHAIVVSDAIDAVRALTERESDGAASIRRTNEALGITGRLVSEPAGR